MASIKCGKCKGTHDSVRLVRACHEGRLVLAMSLEDNLNQGAVFCVDCGIRDTSHQNAAGTVGKYLASDLHPEACAKVQEELELAPLMPLVTEACDWAGTWAEWVELYRNHRNAQDIPGLPGVTVADAANLRDAEVPQPRNPHYGEIKALRRNLANALADIVPDHDKFRMAVRLPHEEDRVRFFRVDTPQKGRWAGFVFLKEQAGDDLHPVKGVAREEMIIKVLLEDAKAALKLYASELESCGICGRTLTDEESRARGIGPICADKVVGAF